MNFYSKDTKKDIIKTHKHEERFRNSNICWFCETKVLDNKVRDHYHLAGKYRGPDHKKCNIIVKQKYSNFIPLAFHNLSNYDSHLFFKKLIDKKPNKLNLNVIPKTNEEFFSVTYGCIRFIDSYRFLQKSLDKLVKTLNENDFKILIKECPVNWQILCKKLAYPFEKFEKK